METKNFNVQLKQILFLAVILFLGYLLFNNLIEFLPALLGAITFYILSIKLYRYCTLQCHWHKGITAVLFIVIFLLIIVIPISLLINMLGAKVSNALQHQSQLMAGLQTFASKIKSITHFDLLSNQTLQQIQTTIYRVYSIYN
jgi:predicted PurR-regulated permease PerM